MSNSAETTSGLPDTTPMAAADERSTKDRFAKIGEPVGDGVGNQDGGS